MLLTQTIEAPKKRNRTVKSDKHIKRKSGKGKDDKNLSFPLLINMTTIIYSTEHRFITVHVDSKK